MSDSSIIDPAIVGHQGLELPIWVQVTLIVVLLLLSGLFSGLNLGLMALDQNDLKVIASCGTKTEKKYAATILPLRSRGNFLLCSLLLGNVLVNTTLTALLDDITGSGMVAVITATLSIVVVGEIIPQAICSRHGLAVGARTIAIPYIFMALTAPLSYPISIILDKVLGEEIGCVFNREQLMEYIRITREYNRLEDNEVGIISGALALKSKVAGDILTPLCDVFSLPVETKLNYDTVTLISDRGFSRIPIYADNDPSNIIGLLHTRDLALIDPEDGEEVSKVLSYHNHPLVYVYSETRLDVVLEEFKKGKSHMALVRSIQTIRHKKRNLRKSCIVDVNFGQIRKDSYQDGDKDSTQGEKDEQGDKDGRKGDNDCDEDNDIISQQEIKKEIMKPKSTLPTKCDLIKNKKELIKSKKELLKKKEEQKIKMKIKQDEESKMRDQQSKIRDGMKIKDQLISDLKHKDEDELDSSSAFLDMDRQPLTLKDGDEDGDNKDDDKDKDQGSSEDTDEGDPFYQLEGIITLEDIIEEILGAEIVDESDILAMKLREKIKSTSGAHRDKKYSTVSNIFNHGQILPSNTPRASLAQSSGILNGHQGQHSHPWMIQRQMSTISSSNVPNRTCFSSHHTYPGHDESNFDLLSASSNSQNDMMITGSSFGGHGTSAYSDDEVSRSQFENSTTDDTSRLFGDARSTSSKQKSKVLSNHFTTNYNQVPPRVPPSTRHGRFSTQKSSSPKIVSIMDTSSPPQPNLILGLQSCSDTESALIHSSPTSTIVAIAEDPPPDKSLGQEPDCDSRVIVSKATATEV